MSEQPTSGREPQDGRGWRRPLWSFVGLLVAYYSFPVRLGSQPTALLSLALTVAGLGLLGRMMWEEAARVRRGEATRSAQALSLLLLLVVVGFAFGFYMLDRTSPGAMTGLQTRTDALYFTLSTMATVGYGDIHASSQPARAMVAGLIVFDVVVVSALAHSLTTRPPEPESRQPERGDSEKH
jgi:hypothetical protein